MKRHKITALLLAVLMLLSVCSGCGKTKEKILIYTSANSVRMDVMVEKLNEKFPDYDIKIEYISTGQHAAKLLAEGGDTACDITHDLTYTYLENMEKEGILADLSGIVDFSQYTDDVVASSYYAIDCRSSGSVIVNTDMLERLGIPEPTCYEDLLDPRYKDLIVLADPKASGTGYMFLKSLVNAWGEEKAFDYFEKLSENVLQFASSGNGLVNSLVQEEAAVTMGLTYTACEQIDAGLPLKILFFDEGSPYCLYGQGIVSGKEDRECVREVFQYLSGELTEYLTATFMPEKIYKDKDFATGNYPKDIAYSDMSNNSAEEQERLLSKWVIPAE